MTRIAAIHFAAHTAITEAAAIEDWMLEADGAADVALTAHAIRNAAIEAREDLQVALSAYADGYEMPMLAGLRAMDSAMRNVMAWASAVAA
jgi:hypothetical protein